MELSNENKRYLKKISHELKPLILLGKQGFTPELVKAINNALNDHELIKIKFNDFKKEKESLSEKIMKETGCAIVNLVGNVLTIFKMSNIEEKRIISNRLKQ